MAWDKETKDDVRRLLESGHGESEVADITRVPLRTVQDWKKKWREEGGASGIPPRITPARPREPVAAQVAPKEAIWPRLTVSDLLNIGFPPDIAPDLIVLLEDVAKPQGNRRYADFLNHLVQIKKEDQTRPDEWNALLVGFPMLAADLESLGFEASSFREMSELVRELCPHLGKQARRTYHARARFILSQMLEEVRRIIVATTLDKSPYLCIEMNPSPKRGLLRKEPEIEVFLTDKQPSLGLMPLPGKRYSAREYMLRKDLQPFLQLVDILSRLPDVDRQRGKYFTGDFLGILLVWFTAPLDYWFPRTSSESVT
ncbi:MAG: helix-turn-helix domain-containing protein [Dehalococcoidia bacterium]|nr:helix-turn-helix domain-containing protein [Dehalococcoidia bacterium]